MLVSLLAFTSCFSPWTGESKENSENTGTPAVYTVTFNANGGSPAPAPAAVSSGGKVTGPPAMSKTGYAFDGWYKEAGFVNKWNFASDTVTGNITLYANWVSVELVWVEGGTFQMGNGEYAASVHSVTVSGFYMGKTEVTQAQYEDVMENNPSNFKGDNLPVETVNWYEAVEFCNWLSEREGLTPYYTINKTVGSDTNNKSSFDTLKYLVTRNTTASGYRLPTEAEWEYAARGGNGSPENYTYSGSNDADVVAWHGDNSDIKTHEVGKKLPNVLDLYDMSGNVYEWCWDWYEPYSSKPQTNPAGASSGSGRAARGGSYVTTAAEYARSADRDRFNPSNHDRSFGFRLIRR